MPAWDCQPYDRVSPNPGVAAQRMTALARLALTRGAPNGRGSGDDGQCADPARARPRSSLARPGYSVAPGNVLEMETS